MGLTGVGFSARGSLDLLPDSSLAGKRGSAATGRSYAPEEAIRPATGRGSIDNRTHRCDDEVMTGKEFIRRARRYARKHGLSVDFDPRRGKGSHARLQIGQRFTMVPYGELKPGTFRSLLRQLGIHQEDF